MKCIWCNGGKGINHSKSKEGVIFYYVCQKCVGLFIEEQNKQAKALLKATEGD